MRSGGAAGGADEPDDVAALDLVAGPHVVAREVTIARLEPVAVIEDDQIAVAAFRGGVRDDPVSRRIDLAALIGGDIETLMEVLVARDGIRPAAHARCQPA